MFLKLAYKTGPQTIAWAQLLALVSEVAWNTATSMPLCILSGRFRATRALISSCNRDHMANFLLFDPV